MFSNSLVPLLLFVIVATVTPGGATTLATASGARFGFSRSVPLIAGIAIGLATLAAASAAGLAGVLLAAPFLQLGMKLAGSAYLLWLALRIGRSGAPVAHGGPQTPTTWSGGVALLWLNPKGWAMALGAAASFATLSHGPVQFAVLLGAAFGMAACVSLSFWCAAGTLLARRLRTAGHWRVFNSTMAALLVASIVPMWR